MGGAARVNMSENGSSSDELDERWQKILEQQARAQRERKTGQGRRASRRAGENMPSNRLPEIVIVQDSGRGRRRLGWCQNVCVCICLTLITRRYNIREFRIRIKNPDVLIEYRGARICGPDTRKPRPLRDVASWQKEATPPRSCKLLATNKIGQDRLGPPNAESRGVRLPSPACWRQRLTQCDRRSRQSAVEALQGIGLAPFSEQRKTRTRPLRPR